jgi:DNA-binding transcriptional MocR family regulator
MNLYSAFHPGELFGSQELNFDSKLINYHETRGLISEEASLFIQKNENILIHPERILITNGVQEAITIAISCFKRNTLACIEPSYPGFEDAAKSFGCETLKLSESNWLEEIENLPAGSLFYLSADFSNPLGYTLKLEERLKLIEIATRNKFYIFDDATYRPFNLDNPQPSLLSLNSEHVIHAISFSKILAPGLRTGFCAVPNKLITEFISAKANISLNNSGITQEIIKQWLISNEFDLSIHLKKVKERLRINQAILSKHRISFNGGFFCVVNTNKVMSYEFCEQLLIDENISVIPMMLFTENPDYKNQIRLCVANVDAIELEYVLNKLEI